MSMPLQKQTACRRRFSRPCGFQRPSSLGYQPSAQLSETRSATEPGAQTSWTASYRSPPVSASPELGSQVHITMPGFFSLMWVLGNGTQVLTLAH